MIKKNNDILVLNTGGTFNKLYNQITGELFVPKNNNAINNILKQSKISNVDVQGLIYKDSLDITKKDRKDMVNFLQNSPHKKVIIVHGTDTIHKTAKLLDKFIKDKQIILVGSMEPFSINPIEATSNFMQAYGFLLNNKTNNIYISMHGIISKYDKIIKNKKLGIFQCHK
jgi:L-asparaginase